jgi:hypothetical protein
MVRIQLLQADVVSGIKYPKGAVVSVSKWVARAYVNSAQPRAIWPTETDQDIEPVTMAQLEELRAANEWKAAKRLMQERFGISAAGWDALIAKARNVIETRDDDE